MKTEWLNSHGQFHREDGPAIVGPYGESWFLNGRVHRLDGPAIKRLDANNRWFIDGKEYPEELTYWFAVTEWKKAHG